MSPITADRVAAEIRHLPALPALVLELLNSIDDEEFNADALAQKLGRDQALVARLLRVANSPFYGLQEKICTVRQSIVVLGSANVRMLVMAAAMIEQFPPHVCKNLDLNLFWRHAIGVACGARLLAVCGGLNAEIAFVCGLLHDIGKLVLAIRFPGDYARVMKFGAQHGLCMIEAEHQVLGVDHAEVGAALAGRWKFPEPILQALADHHLPDATRMGPFAAVVHIADELVHALDAGRTGDDLARLKADGIWKQLGMDWNDMQKCFAEIEARYEKSVSLIG